tara:strand:- start:2260 stop:2403 length:144 start_codon:yes stop_codon:yes gene_type:complete
MGLALLIEFINHVYKDKLDRHEMILVAEDFIENKKKGESSENNKIHT